MLGNIKEYINTLVVLSIVMFLVEMLLLNNSLKKYVMLVVTSIFLVYTVSPFFKKNDIEKEVTNVCSKITRDLDITDNKVNIDLIVQKEEEGILKEALCRMQEDIKKECIKRKILCKDVIIVTENKNKVKEVILKIKNLDSSILNIKEILSYINETYNIEENLIKVEEEVI